MVKSRSSVYSKAITAIIGSVKQQDNEAFMGVTRKKFLLYIKFYSLTIYKK